MNTFDEEAALKYSSDLNDITYKLRQTKMALASVIKSDHSKPEPYEYSFLDSGGWCIDARTLFNSGLNMVELYAYMRKSLEEHEEKLKLDLKNQVEGCKLCL